MLGDDAREAEDAYTAQISKLENQILLLESEQADYEDAIKSAISTLENAL